MKRLVGAGVLGCLLLLSSLARADEGMWTFDNFPAAAVKAKYGFDLDAAWLLKVRAASVRLAQGCSASIVSPQGLVMTNHHCAHPCIEQLSTAKKDFVESGFYAPALQNEVKCPELEVNQLQEIEDVTARLETATRGLADEAFNEAQRAEMARIEAECATSPFVRCDVVTLYRGGLYHLYKYRRYQDVRLVFAPEFAIAFFGGDPDNFMFPRYDLDLAVLRLYEDGKPASTPQYFKWSASGAAEGELTFVAGNPGGTSRLLTVAQLAFTRDVTLVRRLLYLAELRGLLTEYQHRGKEQKRVANASLFYVENSLKALRGRLEALQDHSFFASKVKAEQELRARVDGDPALKAAYGGAWDSIGEALETYRPMQLRHWMLEGGGGFQSELFGLARGLVRASEELVKPNQQRLREYGDSQLPGLRQSLFSAAPIYDEFEIFLLTFSLGKLRESLGVDDPFVKQLFGKKSPQDLASELVKGTKLKNVKVRQQLFDGGAAAIAASKDPMILFARAVDPEARAARKLYEDRVEGQAKKASELIARAQFQLQGTSTYPDATFTPRLSYGQVKGYQENGRTVPPFTYMDGAFDRHTGREPFALPQSWLAAKPRLNLQTPMNLVTTNDIIGGNSGSPLFNAKAEVVGLVFDGNIQSLGGDYGFDEAVNRTVSVHSAAILEALRNIYKASRIVEELESGR